MTCSCYDGFLAPNINILENQDGMTMAYRWPAGTVFKRIDVDVEDRSCPVCERYMHVCDHRYHRLWTFEGATQVVNRLVHCPDASCKSRGAPSAPKPNCPSACPVGVSAGMYCAGLAIAALPAIGRCLRFERS